LFNHETEFQKIIHPTTSWWYPEDIKGFVQQLIDEYFVSNSNFNFLSTSPPKYLVEYPAVFALSDQATTFACGVKLCYHSTANHADFHIVCRAKSATPIGESIYQI
jgi:hypothetical protein